MPSSSATGRSLAKSSIIDLRRSQHAEHVLRWENHLFSRAPVAISRRLASDKQSALVLTRDNNSGSLSSAPTFERETSIAWRQLVHSLACAGITPVASAWSTSSVLKCLSRSGSTTSTPFLGRILVAHSCFCCNVIHSGRNKAAAQLVNQALQQALYALLA